MQRERPSISKSLRTTGIIFIIISFFVDQKVEFGLLGIAFFVLGTIQFKRPGK
ncbi:hypothetical protein P378_18750 [Desulforamulus profundi]|uniref:Uncharacterized protein n=1 Tax=Desulforamulus profundi TaxID=1383067 RepID=A0A2C6MC41_9FIRM|nr:hypothetical protein P378_18750 [Desulforamulus profundi]